MSNQGTEEHITKPPSMHQPSDQWNGNSCKAPCCTTSIINQPRDKCLLNKTKTIQSGKARCFLSSCYSQFKWIHFCQTRLKFFCYYCVKASSLSGRNIKADQAFVTTGCSNWKKAIEKFKDHEYLVTHKNAVITIAASKDPIDQQLLREVENTKKKQQQSLLRQLSVLHFLLHQGIAICNDHVGASNLSVMLEKVLNESAWVTEGKYQSPECVNEMIEIMAHKVLRSLINDV